MSTIMSSLIDILLALLILYIVIVIINNIKNSIMGKQAYDLFKEILTKDEEKVITPINYESMSVQELKKMAKEKKIDKYYNMKKKDLIKALSKIA